MSTLAKCLVAYLQVLPSETPAVASMTTMREMDGNTSYQPTTQVNSSY